MILFLKKYLSYMLIAVIAFTIGYYFCILYQYENSYNYGKFPLTNPALNYNELRQHIQNNKHINLSNYINSYIQEKKASNQFSHVSVYFRNLNNGGRFGINEKEYFSPASLMKLPVLISYIKKSETEPGLLQQKIVYKKNPQAPSFKQNIAPTEQLQEGVSYSIEDILIYMMKYSDNNASFLLEEKLPPQDLLKIYTDLGIQFPQMNQGNFDNNVTVVDFASFFRVLFNASYLTRENSEKVLNILRYVTFHDGLESGIEKDIIVAHKFGERGIVGTNGQEEKQLHDCGIVYYPNHPYILCLMTRGNDRNLLKKTLTELSQYVYQEVKNQYGDNPLDIE